MVSPDSQAIACPLSGRNSTYRTVQISGTGSDSELDRQCYIVRDGNGQALAYLAALLSADAQRTVRCFYLIRTFRLRPSRETKRTFGRFDGDAACRSVGIVDELVELNARLRADFEIAIIVKAKARDADDAGLYVILMVDVAAGGQRVLAAVRAFRLRSDRGGAADGLLAVGGAR
jgi:hypothetical protein